MMINVDCETNRKKRIFTKDASIDIALNELAIILKKYFVPFKILNRSAAA